MHISYDFLVKFGYRTLSAYQCLIFNTTCIQLYIHINKAKNFVSVL